MALNKSEKKKIKYDTKKIGRIFCFAFLTIALLVGIIFSSVKVNMNMIYGPEYNGAYQASVQITDKDGKDVTDSQLDGIAEELSDKLAPFSDKSLTISKQGHTHLNVIVGKSDYENSQSYFRDQIESNGGMFVLSGTPGDKLDSGTLTDFYIPVASNKNDGADTNTKRLTNSDIFSNDISTKTISNGSGRDPFIQFGLKGEASANGFVKQLGSNKDPLYFITNLEDMINQLRYFYEVNNNEGATRAYFDYVISPIAKMYQTYSNSSKQEDKDHATILKYLFGGTTDWKQNGAVVPLHTKFSLIDEKWFSGDNNSAEPDFLKNRQWTTNYDDFKFVLSKFTPNTEDMPTSNFLYGADADNEAINAVVKDWANESSSTLNVKKQQSFKWIVNDFINNDVLIEKSKNSNTNVGIRTELVKYDGQLKDYILFAGNTLATTKGTTDFTSVVNSGDSFVVDDTASETGTSKLDEGFYLRTSNLSAAKKAIASFKLNASGIKFFVESIANVNPYITSALYITSLVFLSLIALLLAIYVLFVYRLLGLFTLIIAACAVAITLLAATGFGIAMGPQVIAALFLIIALILDSNFIVFEGFKRNYYEKKKGIVSSFNIGNKETLATAIDTLLIAFIPNIILFWVASGPLKTFGTLSIIGIALTVVCGIIIGRFIYWLILKSKVTQENDWLLPIDTRYTVVETMRDEFAINKYTKYLENHEGKTKYTSKELVEIQNAKKKLEDAKKSYHKHLLVSNAKTVEKDKKTINSIKKENSLIVKFKNWFIKTFKVKHLATNPIVKAADARIDDNNFVLDVEKQSDSASATDKVGLKDKGNIVRRNRLIGRGTFFLAIVLFVITIISAIVGGAAGVPWANGVGYGQQFVVYGNQLDKMVSNLGNAGHNGEKDRFSLIGDPAEKWQDIKSKYTKDENEAVTSDKKYEVYAYELRDFFAYINENDLFSEVGQKSYTKKINLKDAEFTVLIDYHHINKNEKDQSKDLVALRIDSNATDKHSRSTFKRLLIAMATGRWPNANDVKHFNDVPSGNGEVGGIYAYDLAPYTVDIEIKNVAIAFGIAIAVLIAYILIRFKWTYYVALALGLGLVIGTVVALVVMFQVPMSSEMLCGMVFVISFALTSIVLVLGKGKSQLDLTNKESIEKNFSEVVELSAQIRAKKAVAKAVYAPIKKKMRALQKQMMKIRINNFKNYKADEEYIQLLNEYGELKNDYKAKRKAQLDVYKKFKYETKQKENELQRHNWYFKELFSNLIKYSAWRMATLGVFYLLVGIILAATLPSIFSMGLTIIFGLIATFAVTLFISVPVWVYFEKRRIRYVYGRKKYIKSLKVSREEETVKGIND